MKTLAIIPARGGSKGIPNKNIVDFCGKPLIAWTIEAAQDSQCFEDVIVSTDSNEIAQISLKYTNVHERASIISKDHSSSVDVVLSVLYNPYWSDKNFTHICLLQPTSPLRTSEDICGSMNVINKYYPKYDLVSVTKKNDYNLYFEPNDEYEQTIDLSSHKESRRQDNNTMFYLNGAIYINEIENFIKTKTFYQETVIGYVMPFHRSWQIDEPHDLVVAKALKEAYA